MPEDWVPMDAGEGRFLKVLSPPGKNQTAPNAWTP